MLTEEFRYDLPEDMVAHSPAEPRDSARLLDTRDLTDHRFRDLPWLLGEQDLLVVNSSRVRAGKVRGRKAGTGGVVEMLVLSDLGRNRWEVMVRPGRRLRPGIEIDFGSLLGIIEEGPKDGRAVVRLTARNGRSVTQAIEQIGHVPLPPYIRRELEDPDRYQTIFADRLGSAAAPTAGLHFTEGLLEDLVSRGISLASVDLQVGVDTFRPITAERLADHRMHSEHYSVPSTTAEAIASARQREGRVIAVGTTVVRALETCSIADGLVKPGTGSTDLFVTPGYPFRVVDGLVTNFHLPGSSLIVLLAAFMGEGWRKAYEIAVARQYRFLSFGDAMYAERPAS